MTCDADVIVVGTGVNGTASARALAARGHDVLAFEQHEIGTDRGSSHGSSRIFRLAYPEPRLVDLALRALAGWRALEEESGRRLLLPVGSLDIGSPARAIARALDVVGVPHELLDGADAAGRWPLATARDEPVLFQPDGAVTLADRALEALVDSARRHGARVRERTGVTALRDTDGHVVVETTSGTFRARVAVVAAGAWTRALVRPAGIDLALEATRETVAFFGLAGADALPTVIDWSVATAGEAGIRDGAVPYALAAPGVGLKVGLHHAGPATDPDAPAEASEAVVARASSWVARRFRAAGTRPLAVETCIYTNTADEEFVLERHGRIVVASACSGHGFKFAPVTGERIAALAAEALAAP